MSKKLIAPSLLSADFLNLNSEIEMINRSQADYLHLDIMDGMFVPNITFGWSLIKQIKSICIKPLDVHLMIANPERYIKEFAAAGSNLITVHYEACTHLHRTLHAIKESGAKAGVSINPHTPILVLSEILNEVDLILIMSVNPGFGGQNFIPNTLNKISQLSEIRTERKLNFLIEIDGGVTTENAAHIFEMGADILVAGNSVFKASNPIEAIKILKV